MNLNQYVIAVAKTCVYPGAGTHSVEAVGYVSLGLAGEVGEICNQAKKISRDDEGVMTSERHLKIFDEVGDVFWYLFRLCAEVGILPEQAMRANAAKLEGRQQLGTLNGDRREED